MNVYLILNKEGFIYLACFLKNNNQIYIISSHFNLFNSYDTNKVYDLNGNKIKEINDSYDIAYFIDSYFDSKLNKNYIITGNNGFSKSYDFNENRLYHKYFDKIKNKENDNNGHCSIIVFNNGYGEIQLIDSSYDGNIRIWNFNSGLLLKKIKVCDKSLFGISLWNNEYLFIGSEKNLIILKINNGKINNIIDGHKYETICVKTIYYNKYGNLLITQGFLNDYIKLWKIKNK